MLAKWIFVLMIDGKAQIVSESVSEAICLQAMARVTAVRSAEGKTTDGGCYILTTERR
jgi:hypothetical protein